MDSISDGLETDQDRDYIELQLYMYFIVQGSR